MKKLSVIILCYNSANYIQKTLDSVFKNLPKDSEVIVLDNASSDSTIEILENYKGITFINNGQNLGFSRGNNIGAKKAQGEYLLFLNHDTKVKNGAIQKMLDYAENHPNVGIVGPKLWEGEKLQQSVSKFPTLIGAIQEYWFGKKKAYSQFAPNFPKPTEVDVVYGAAMLIRKDRFEKAGRWDERYFLYFEDIELCKKMNKLGYKVIYLPSAEIEHQVGASVHKGQSLPFGIRTLAHFIPLKQSGSYYYLMQSANIYHGTLIATLIRIVSFIAKKLHR